MHPRPAHPITSPITLTRRDAIALIGATLAAAATSPAGAATAALGPPRRTPDDPLFRISLAQWSLNRTLFAKELDHLDFAPTARRLGFEGVEYVNTFFKDKATDAGYLAQMNARAADAGVRQLLIMIDNEGNLGDPDEAARTRAIDNHVRWLDAARTLGCHAIRVNARSEGTYDEQQDRAADGLRRLTELGDQRGLNVIVENHGGLSSNGAWLAGVIQKVNHPRCGTLPDFGNFQIAQGQQYDRYQGVREMMPYAKAVSAKSHDFDEHGNETHTDYRKMMRIVLDAGHRAFVGVEYEGAKHPEEDGILLTKRLLETVRDEIAAERATPASPEVP